MNSLKEIAGVLGRSSKVLICGHVAPDGDCLGSVAALGMVLERMGKTVTMASPDPIPEILGFLPGVERFAVAKTDPQSCYDTMVVLDCSVPNRLGSFGSCLSGDLTSVNIDHHVESDSFARYNYLDPGAAATGEILIDLFDEMGESIDFNVAVCLYTALVTDTGSFQYENTTSGTLKKAARLMDTGIPCTLVNLNIYEEKPLPMLRLLGASLLNMRVSPCGRIAWLALTREDLKSHGAQDHHTDGFVNALRSLRGVEIAILFREIDDGVYRVAFRSKKYADVHRLAAELEGGGHMRASGCTMQGDLEKITGKVLEGAYKELSRKDQF